MHLTGSNTKIYAFDTFSGFPEGGRLDSPSFDPTLDAYRVYENFSVSYVRNQLLQWSSEGETARIEFIPGLIPDSLSKFPDGETVRLLHLDLDLHVPYLASLQFFWDKLESGGLVLFDEYDQGEDLVKWPGAKLAIDHFCQEHDLEVEKMWSGFSYIKKP